MNDFLNDLVLLNKVMLANAQEQFSDPPAPMVMARGMAVSNLENLTAEVNTQLVSGEKRYEITTSTNQQDWKLNISFDLRQRVDVLPLLVLAYTAIDGSDRQVLFDQVAQEGSSTQYNAVMNITKLAQRDELLRALSVYESETTLVVSIQSNTSTYNVITNPQTFYFDPKYYPYIFRGLLPPVPVQGYILQPFVFNNFWSNYYQDNITKTNLYYLPDSFEFGKYEDRPLLAIYFSAPEGATKIDQSTTTFQYFLLPKVNKQRINSAGTEFKKQEANGRTIPLSSATKMDLSLQVPGKNGAIDQQKQKNATISLQGGISGSFTVPATEFQSVWNAFFNPAPNNLLMKGSLEITIGLFSPDNVPVKLSVDSKFKDQMATFINKDHPSFLKRTLTFQSSATSYAPGPKPIKSMLIESGGTTIQLTKDKLSDTITTNIPLFEVIAASNQNTPVKYTYNLMINYNDGSSQARNNLTSTFSIINVPPAL